MSLITRVTTELIAQLTSSGDFTTPTAAFDLREQTDLATGTGAGQADKAFLDQRTLAASATEDLDLAGVLTDALGATITFVKVKAIFIRAAAANTNNVVVGAASGAPWAALLNSTGTLTFRPGSRMMFAAGAADATAYAVTATTADLLKVANSGAGTSVTYDIAVIGTSA